MTTTREDRLAARVRAAGFPVLRVAYGDDQEDGEIDITPTVSLQVPTFGGPPGVVVQSGEGDDLRWTFYPPRRRFADLVFDLKRANAPT